MGRGNIVNNNENTELEKIAHMKAIIKDLCAKLDHLIANIESMLSKTGINNIDELDAQLDELVSSMEEYASYENFRAITPSMATTVSVVKGYLPEIQQSLLEKKEKYQLIRNTILPRISKQLEKYEQLVILQLVTHTCDEVIKEFNHHEFPRTNAMSDIRTIFNNEIKNVNMNDIEILAQMDKLLEVTIDQFPITEPNEEAVEPLYYGGLMDDLEGIIPALIGPYDVADRVVQSGVDNLDAIQKYTVAVLDEINQENKNPIDADRIAELGDRGWDAWSHLYVSPLPYNLNVETAKRVKEMQDLRYTTVSNIIHKKMEIELVGISEALDKIESTRLSPSERNAVIDTLAATADQLIALVDEPSKRAQQLYNQIQEKLTKLKSGPVIGSPKK